MFNILDSLSQHLFNTYILTPDINKIKYVTSNNDADFHFRLCKLVLMNDNKSM